MKVNKVIQTHRGSEGVFLKISHHFISGYLHLENFEVISNFVILYESALIYLLRSFF